MFTRTSTSSTPKVAFLLALLLLFALSTAALAAPLTNGNFDDCTLNSWTTTGNVSVMEGSSSIAWMAGSDCLAKVHTQEPLLRRLPYTGSSTLRQTFEVPTGSTAGAQQINFNIWARSSNGIDPIDCNCYVSGSAYKSQIITILDAQGNEIYTRGRNINSTSSQTGIFSYNLAAYAGQTVTVEITTSIDTSITSSPTYSTLYVDDFRFGPTPYGGGGTYGW